MAIAGAADSCRGKRAEPRRERNMLDLVAFRVPRAAVEAELEDSDWHGGDVAWEAPWTGGRVCERHGGTPGRSLLARGARESRRLGFWCG